MATPDPAGIVEAPLVVQSGDNPIWHDEADVVVVGLGIAGASAAIQARDCGADVLIVDRFDGGGATRWSGGIYYAGGTSFQRDAGVADDAEEMFKYLSLEVENAVSRDTLRRFCDQSEANVQWLTEQGVRFEGSLYKEKATFPPEDKYLYYSGNEKVPAFAQAARPAPRGHRVYGKGWTGYVIAAQLKAAAERGTRQMAHSRAVRLVQDEAGVVIGLEVLTLPEQVRAAHQALFDTMDPMRPFGLGKAEKLVAEARALEARHGSRKLIRARRGVVLACGGFAYNLQLVRQYMPAIADTVKTLLRMSSLSCDGSGILLGESVGARSEMMDKPFLGRMLSPPEATMRGIIVNKLGRRFINEDSYNSILGGAILDQPGAQAWLVVDRATLKLIRRQALDLTKGTFKNFGAPTMLNLLFGGTRKGRTLKELGRACGFPEEALVQSVAELNEAIDRHQPDPAGKASENCVRFGAGPYYALNTAVTNVFSFMPFFTLGGLRVDEASGGVLSRSGGHVEGLYAAGRTAVGVCSDGYISGLSLADGVFSGRRAGAAVAGVA